ncbi:hypothetical protein ACYCFK_09425 [Stutzerimonas stutzeri]
MNYRLGALALILSCSVAGCAVYTDKLRTDSYADESSSATRNQLLQHSENVSLAAKQAAQTVDRPWITGKAQPLAREVTLPAPLRGVVDTVMLYRDNEADLVTLAARIHETTGIMVQVNPDALLPPENFRPRLGGISDGSNNLLSASAPVTAALYNPTSLDGLFPTGQTEMRNSGPYRSTPKSDNSIEPLRTVSKQPLPAVLDAIALRLGVYWRYDSDLAALVFFRTETRAFEIRNAELIAESQVSVGLTGGVSTQSSGSGLTSESKSSLSMMREDNGPIAGVVQRVEQYMTVSGQIAAGSGGLIVVTDTKAALDQIERYLEQENRMRGRRIELIFEEITIENSTSSQAGIDWNLMFQSGERGNGINVSGLNSLLEQEGAALTLGASIGSGQWQGSSIAVQALSRVGRIVDRKINSFGTNNGQPATTGRPERQKYISELEQTQSYSDSSSPTVSVTQEEEVSGRVLTVIPYAYSTGDINMTIKYDNTPTPVFERQVMPDGSYVQSPRSISEVLVRSATLKSGQPLVINAFSSNVTQYDERRIDRRAPMLFGGSDVAGQSERVTVLVLTAMVRE